MPSLAAGGQTSQAAQPFPDTLSCSNMSSLLQSLIPETHPHCYTHEVRESTKPTASVSPERQCNSFTHLSCILGQNHSPGKKQCCRRNSSTCLKGVHLPVPLLPSVRCQGSDCGLHFSVLRDVLM